MIKIFSVSLLILSVIVVDPADAAKEVFTPSIEVKEEYTDNLFLSTLNVVDDYITTVSPKVLLARETERYQTSFNARIDATAYGDNNELNSTDYSLKGDFGYYLNPLLNFDFDAGYSRDSRSDRDIDVSGLVLSTNKRVNKNFAGNVSYNISEKSAGSLSYNYFRSDIDDPAYSDYYSHNWSAGLSSDLSSHWLNTVGLINLGYGTYEYTNASIDNYNFVVGVQKNITELYSFRFTAGPRYTRSEFRSIGQKNSQWGLKIDASLIYTGEKTRSSLNFSKDINKGTSDSTGTSENTSISAEVNYHFAEEWNALLNASYHLNESDSGELSTTERDENTINLSPSIRYKISTDIDLVASYKYTIVENDTANTQAERNLIFAKIDWKWPILD